MVVASAVTPPLISIKVDNDDQPLHITPSVRQSREVISAVNELAKGYNGHDLEDVSRLEAKKLPLLLSASCCDCALVDNVVKLFSLLADENPNEDDAVLEHIEVGLILLTDCSKSAKLSRAWKLLGEMYEKDEYNNVNDDASSASTDDILFNNESLKALLGSFLTAILACLQKTLKFTTRQYYEIVTSCADYVAGKVVEFLGKTNEISFDEFSDFYNSGGFEWAPWIEILDLRKWLVMEDADDSSSVASTTSATSDAVDADSYTSSPSTDMKIVSFEFPLPRSNENLKISITHADMKLLKRVTTRTHLIDRSAEEVATLLMEASDDEGKLSKARFDECIRALVPGSDLSNEERTEFSVFLSCLFYCFDLADENEVNVLDFASGFTLLCGGNKSEKLTLAFDLVGGGKPLNRKGMYRFFRNFLTLLVGITYTESEKIKPMSHEVWAKLVEAIEYGADWTASNLFKRGDDTDFVTFEGFAEWYRLGGFEVAPWLELLDLSKFFSLTAVATAAPSSASSSSSATSCVSVVYTFPIADNDSLVITDDDVDYVYRVLVGSTSFMLLTPQEMLEVLGRFTNWEEDMSEENFIACLAELVKNVTGTSMTTEVQHVFSNLFKSYNFSVNDGSVSIVELLVGLTVICSGKKSSKLQFAFEMFDVDSDGRLTALEVFLFFRSFLVMIFSCTTQGLEMTGGKRHTVITNTAKMVTEFLFLGNKSGTVSFDEFGDWYNGGGFEVAPWLELLDVHKWMNGDDSDKDDGEEYYDDNGDAFDYMPLPPFPQTSPPKPCANANADANANANANAITSSNSALEFLLSTNTLSGGIVVQMSSHVINSVYHLLTSTNLHKTTFSNVGNVLLQCDSDGAISKSDFDTCIRTVLPGTMMTKQQRLDATVLFNKVFRAFDRESSGTVDTSEFATGFSLLCGGNKSDKLLWGWKVIDADEDGMLGRRDLWKFFRSYLTVLMALSTSSDLKDTIELKKFIDTVDAGSVWASQQVFEGVGGRNSHNKRLISFDELADWYSREPNKTPWIELLDVKKWVVDN